MGVVLGVGVVVGVAAAVVLSTAWLARPTEALSTGAAEPQAVVRQAIASNAAARVGMRRGAVDRMAEVEDIGVVIPGWRPAPRLRRCMSGLSGLSTVPLP